MHSGSHFRYSVLLLIGLTLFLARPVYAVSPDALFKATGVEGGLVVHVGCGDGKITAELRRNERYLVHGLDCDGQRVDQAREHIRSLGIYGPVAVDRFDGADLPYVNDSVNLLIVQNAWQVSGEELFRVLAPRGQALIAPDADVQGLQRLSAEPLSGLEGWTRLTKRVSPDVDQWTHFLHDASGNAVAGDQQVGSPTSLRWVAGPRWCRSHEMPSSVGAVVTANGRIFTILDEGPSGVFEKLPAKCSLVARDAANGVLLWKIPLLRWQEENGSGRGNRWNIHHTIPRRLVVDGDRVYVTLQFADSPVSVLNAATGKVLIQALDGTEGADELLLTDGVLIVKCTKVRSVGATVRMRRTDAEDTLVAFDANTGTRLWREPGCARYALCLGSGARASCVSRYECIDLPGHSQRIRSLRVPHDLGTPMGGETNLLIAEDVVLFHGQPLLDTPAIGQGKKRQKTNGSRKKALHGILLGRRQATLGGSRPQAMVGGVHAANGCVLRRRSRMVRQFTTRSRSSHGRREEDGNRRRADFARTSFPLPSSKGDGKILDPAQTRCGIRRPPRCCSHA